MPALWSDTVEKHREVVRDAILGAAAALAAEHGPLGVTMSDLAERAGIGRATLYKYFPDVESVLVAWHDRQIEQHLQVLKASIRPAEPPAARLRSVLTLHAQTLHSEHQGAAVRVHAGAFTSVGDDHIEERTSLLRGLIAQLISDASAARSARGDIPAEELATYCFHALSAASHLKSKAAVRRLVATVCASVLIEP